MEIRTYISEHEPPGMSAHFVAEVLNGIARGCRYLFPRWHLPLLYKSGVDFRLPPDHGGGVERFDLPPTVHKRGWGDCDNLVIWRLCELHHHGEHAARADTGWMGNAMHVRVLRGDGRTTEDPARILLARRGVIIPEFPFKEFRPK